MDFARQVMQAIKEIGNEREKIKTRLSTGNEASLAALKLQDDKLAALVTSARGSQEQSFGKLDNDLATLLEILQDNDMPVTKQTLAAVKEAGVNVNALLIKLKEMKEIN